MDTELAQLKQILLGDEYEQLLALKDKFNNDKAFTALVANVVAEALKVRNEKDGRIDEVLAPTIDKALAGSINQDPKKLAESLYPIMGPAIRKSISETLQQMLENFNHLLEDSFSPKALRWRFDAWRTGTPYSEFIMLQTLDYQVEQVFLIHKESSLLIQHHFSDLVETQDPDMVSGMFSAIQDFIEDSFSTQEQDKLDTLRLGELSVLLTRGPDAVLATVVRGRVPEHIRGEMTTTLEAISIDKREELAEYAGDPAAFADIEEDLCKLLQAQRKEPEEKKTPWKAIVIIVAIFIAIGVWAYQQHQQSLLRDDLISTLRQEPGLVVLDQNFSKRIFRITVLSDPHARKPSDVIATEYKYFDVSFEQYSHLSALDSIIAKRAQELLQPPATVELGVENNVLSLHGTTNDDWFKTFEQRWPAITGLKNINLDSLTILYPTREAIAVATKVIEGMELNFEKGQTGFQANDELIIAIAENINRLNALALKTSGKPIRIDVIGYTDASGSSRTNKWIGLQRANNLKAALVRQGVAAIMLKTYSSLTYPLQGELSERKTRLVVHFN